MANNNIVTGTMTSGSTTTSLFSYTGYTTGELNMRVNKKTLKAGDVVRDDGNAVTQTLSGSQTGTRYTIFIADKNSGAGGDNKVRYQM